MILNRNKIAALAAVLVLGLPVCSYGAQSGAWDLSEDGKHWMYFYSADEPAKDEWIEYEGKEYYVDSKGYMKTGWVVDKGDGNKYYMGKDGAKCFNMFTPDGRYVGPDGLVLDSFDTYRKTVSKQLTKLMKDKAYKGKQPGFMLKDINGDGYRDIVVMDDVQQPVRVVMAAVWNPEEEELGLAAEADPVGTDLSSLTCNKENGSVWLTIIRENGDKDFFMMEDYGMRFENIWRFEQKSNEWGDPVYYVNGARCKVEEWDQDLAEASQDAGGPLTEELLPLNEETLKLTVDQEPGEELSLWLP